MRQLIKVFGMNTKYTWLDHLLTGLTISVFSSIILLRGCKIFESSNEPGILLCKIAFTLAPVCALMSFLITKLKMQIILEMGEELRKSYKLLTGQESIISVSTISWMIVAFYSCSYVVAMTLIITNSDKSIMDEFLYDITKFVGYNLQGRLTFASE